MLADGTSAKALTGVDDHSRFCVSAVLMRREHTRGVCDGFAAALRTHGVPAQVLTDNGKVFTGRFGHPPVEVLFDRICRANGIEHLLTAPRSPTTTGKIERFHRTLRAEFDTRRVFDSLPAAQAELDAWVARYNAERPHQALQMATPAARFARRGAVLRQGVGRISWSGKLGVSGRAWPRWTSRGRFQARASCGRIVLNSTRKASACSASRAPSVMSSR